MNINVSVGSMPKRLMIHLLLLLLSGFGLGIFPALGNSKEANTPDGVVRLLVKGIQHNQPRLLWEQLPASDQQAISDLIHQFARVIDSEVYHQAVRISRQLVSLLQHKKSFVFNGPLLASSQAQASKAELHQQWDALINLLNTVVTSDLARLDTLKQVQVVDFLNHTGRTLLQQLSAVPGAAQTIQTLKATKTIQLATLDGDRATVILIDNQGQSAQIALSRRAEHWLPTDWFQHWQPRLNQAKQSLAQVTPQKMAQHKAQVIQAMNLLEMMLTQLAQSQSQAQFDQAMMGVMMGLMGLSVVSSNAVTAQPLPENRPAQPHSISP